MPRFFSAKIPSNQHFTEELYYKLIWRKKIGSEFLVFAHSAVSQCARVGITGIFSCIFGKYFVEITKVTKELMWGNISLVREILSFFHNAMWVCKTRNSLCHAEFFPSNQFRIKSFSENIDFTEFL